MNRKVVVVDFDFVHSKEVEEDDYGTDWFVENSILMVMDECKNSYCYSDRKTIVRMDLFQLQ